MSVFTVLIEHEYSSHTYVFNDDITAQHFVDTLRELKPDWDIYHPVETEMLDRANMLEYVLDEIGWPELDEEDECECITTDMSGNCLHCLRTPAEQELMRAWRDE